MLLTFSQIVPASFEKAPIVISGPSSLSSSAREYVLFWKEEEIIAVYEVQYDVYSGPFEKAAMIGRMLYVGHSDYFYLFDTVANELRLRLRCEGYFGHFYIDETHCYVADASGLYCVNTGGHILWQNNQLGIDGVILEQWDAGRLCGSGEWDPPGGWRNFVLDKQTGKLVV